MLKSVPYHFTLGDVYMDRFVYTYCKGTWIYSPNIEPKAHWEISHCTGSAAAEFDCIELVGKQLN